MSTKLTYAVIYDKDGDPYHDTTEDGDTCAEIFASRSTYDEFSYALIHIPKYAMNVNAQTAKLYIKEILPKCFLPCALVDENNATLTVGFSKQDITPYGPVDNVYVPDHLLAIVSGIRYIYHPNAIGIVQKAVQFLSQGWSPWNALQMAHLTDFPGYSSYYGLFYKAPFKLTEEEDLLQQISEWEHVWRSDDERYRKVRMTLRVPELGLQQSWEESMWRSVNNLFHMWMSTDHIMEFTNPYVPTVGTNTWEERRKVMQELSVRRQRTFDAWQWILDLYGMGLYETVRDILSAASFLPTERFAFAKEFALDPKILTDYEKQRRVRSSGRAISAYLGSLFDND